MKTIKGIGYEEFTAKVIHAIEIEYTEGGRCWKYGTWPEVEKYTKPNTLYALSDMDVACVEYQSEDIRECFIEVERLCREESRFLKWDEVFDRYGDDADDAIDGLRAEFRLTAENMLMYVKAGKSIITLHSGKTGTHYTYQIRKHQQKALWFVSLLTGTNNDSDYSYMAHFYNDNQLKTTSKSCVAADSKPVLAFRYFMDHINNIPEALGVYHAGKCCRCGHTITAPESVQSGIGPECAKLLGVK